jgi:hypothetical protein
MPSQLFLPAPSLDFGIDWMDDRTREALDIPPQSVLPQTPLPCTQKYQVWRDGLWKDSILIEYLKPEDHLWIRSVSKWEPGINRWILREESSHAYDSVGRVAHMVMKSWVESGENHPCHDSISFFYGDKGLSEKIVFAWCAEKHDWVPSRKVEYDCTEECSGFLETRSAWDALESEWVPSSRQVAVLSESGEDSIYTQVYGNADWSLAYLRIVKALGEEKVIQEKVNQNGSMVPTKEYVIRMDENDRASEYLKIDIDGASRDSSLRATYSYDQDGRLGSMTAYIYKKLSIVSLDQTEWVPSYRKSYSRLQGVSGVVDSTEYWVYDHLTGKNGKWQNGQRTVTEYHSLHAGNTKFRNPQHQADSPGLEYGRKVYLSGYLKGNSDRLYDVRGRKLQKLYPTGTSSSGFYVHYR